jgi:hypothetical protein
MEQLKIKFGEDIFRKAQALSSVLNEPNDVADIQTFILLIRTYGYEAVKKANEITARYKKGSGRFDITTTIDHLRIVQ